MSKEEPTPEIKASQLALWRARFGFQCVASLALIALLLIVLFGLGKSWRASLGEYYAQETLGARDGPAMVFIPGEGQKTVASTPDSFAGESVYRSFNEFIYRHGELVDGLHKWLGYLLIVLIPLSGYLLVVCGRRRPHGPGILRVLGIATIVLGLSATIFVAATGKFSGRVQARAEAVGPDTVMISSRSASEEEALDLHLQGSYYLIGFAVCLMMVGGIAVSTPKMKSAAGIGKDRKRA